MRTYIHKILNNCADVSCLALQKKEVKISYRKRIEMYIHITFCKCCKNFIRQSDIMDQKMKLYKNKMQEYPNANAPDDLKTKLEKIISEEV